MRALCIALVLLSSSACAQYTYWTYNGVNDFPTSSVWSLTGYVEDSTFRTCGTYIDTGTRGFQSQFRLSDGVKLYTDVSTYFDNCYLAAAGFLPQSFIPMPDGGFITVRAETVQSGYLWPRFIRFTSSMDTLWVRNNMVFNDPEGGIYQNTPLFILPIEGDKFLSVSFAGGGGSFLRFCTHSMETGEIITDGLWDRNSLNFNEDVSGLGVEGGVLTEDDSVFVWGKYYHEIFTGSFAQQMFYAKFDLLGNVGSYKLTDPDATTLAEDDEGKALLKEDTLVMFYTDGLEVQGVGYGPYTCELKARRLLASNLNIVEDVHLTFPPLDGVSMYGGIIHNVEPTQDDGYLVTLYTRPTPASFVSYVVKINEVFELEWYTLLIPESYLGTTGLVILEAHDESIIVGGMYYAPVSELAHEYFIKLDACGYMVPSDCPEFVSVADGEIRREGFRLWPNPGTGAVDAIVPFNARQLQVVDASGRCVYTEDLYYPRQTWQLTHLPNGVYTFIVHTEDGRKHHQRWVKQ